MLGPLEPQEQLDRPVFKDQLDHEVRKVSRVIPDQRVLQDRRAKSANQAELATRVKLVRRVQSAARVLRAPLDRQEALERPVKLVQLVGPGPQALEAAQDLWGPWVTSDRWVPLDPRGQLDQVDLRVNRDLWVSRVHPVILDLRDPWDSLDLLAAQVLLEALVRLETREKLGKLVLLDPREARDQQDQLETRDLQDSREQLELQDPPVE